MSVEQTTDKLVISSYIDEVTIDKEGIHISEQDGKGINIKWNEIAHLIYLKTDITK